MLDPSDVGLIFDFDNTLIHSTIDFRKIRQRLIALLRTAGLEDESDERLMAMAIPQLVERGRQRDEALAARMWDVISEEEDVGLKDADVVEHAADVLRELRRRGFRLGLLTNNRRGATMDRLAAFGLRDPFAAIATRDDLVHLKPHPEGIDFLTAQLPGIRRAYVIGDSWVDGETAAGAGVPFIGFGPREHEVRARGVQPWAWITDLRELLDLDLCGDQSSDQVLGG